MPEPKLRVINGGPTRAPIHRPTIRKPPPQQQPQELPVGAEPLSVIDQADLVTALLHDDAAALAIRARVPVNLFTSRVIRDIVSRAYSFVDQYGTAPKAHADSITQDLLTAGNEHAALVTDVLVKAQQLSTEGFNASFVIGRLDRFVWQQRLMAATIEGHALIKRGDLEGVAALYAKAAAKASSTGDAGAPTVTLKRADTITPEGVRWLWHEWLPRGKLTLIAGMPEAGKTTISLSFAATITRGGRWPDGTRLEAPGAVLIWSGEDGAADTLIPRLMAMGAKRDRIFIVDGVSEGGKPGPFDPARHLPALQATAQGIEGGVALLIVDPVVQVVAGDAHRANEVRRGLQPLVDLAEELGAAVIGITHVVKGSRASPPLDRVLGSIGFAALARVVLMAAQRKDDPAGGRVLVRAKSNLGPGGDGFAYLIEATEVRGYTGVVATKVRFVGEQLKGLAHELLREAEGTEETDRLSGTRSDRQDAEDFLRAILADGQVDSKTVKAKAKEQGLTDYVVRTARERLGVVIVRTGAGDGHESAWALPEPRNP